jgi:hypothetical protein
VVDALCAACMSFLSEVISNRAADTLSRQDVDPMHSTWGSLNLDSNPSKPQNFIHKSLINDMVMVNSDTID